jgi:hypothetical protein
MAIDVIVNYGDSVLVIGSARGERLRVRIAGGAAGLGPGGRDGYRRLEAGRRASDRAIVTGPPDCAPP